LPSARKRGISDDDIRHAVNNAVAAITAPHQPDFTMLVGATLSGQLLEIGILSADDNHYVIHAMPARTRYVKMIKAETRWPVMKTKKHPRDLSDADTDAIVATFDDNANEACSITDAATLAELRAAAAARREAEGRIERIVDH
jgi:hypothetical protein